MRKIGTIGEILVEIVALDAGHGFREPLRLAAPYPSGARAVERQGPMEGTSTLAELEAMTAQ